VRKQKSCNLFIQRIYLKAQFPSFVKKYSTLHKSIIFFDMKLGLLFTCVDARRPSPAARHTQSHNTALSQDGRKKIVILASCQKRLLIYAMWNIFVQKKEIEL
jgi:hypothetical protein